MELMVVLTIAAIIVGLGAPSFNRFRLNARLTNSANDVLATLSHARTEAIKSQVNVSVCATTTPASATATCTYASNAGWIAFRDLDGNCVRAAGEPLVGSGIYDHSFNAQPLTVRVNGDCVSFSPNGFTRNPPAPGVTSLDHILMCDNRGIGALSEAGGLSAGRGIVIDRTGRARVVRTVTGALADNVTNWNGMAGVNLSCP